MFVIGGSFIFNFTTKGLKKNRRKLAEIHVGIAELVSRMQLSLEKDFLFFRFVSLTFCLSNPEIMKLKSIIRTAKMRQKTTKNIFSYCFSAFSLFRFVAVCYSPAQFRRGVQRRKENNMWAIHVISFNWFCHDRPISVRIRKADIKTEHSDR